MNGKAALTLVILKVSNSEAHIFITGLNDTPTTIKLQNYNGYLFFVGGNNLTAVYNYSYVVYVIWARGSITQLQLMKLLRYLAE